MTDYFGMYDDWVPRRCGTCAAVFTKAEMGYVECGSDHPNACDCGSSSHKASFVCPVCSARAHDIAPTFGEVAT